MTEQERKNAKIERLKWLREQYKKLEQGASPAEKKALLFESAILQKRIEVAGRDTR